MKLNLCTNHHIMEMKNNTFFLVNKENIIDRINFIFNE